MIKKKKGFTLVELIVTIGLMALIGVVIAMNMSGLFSKQNDEEYENFKKRIEDSACIYVETKWSSTKRQNCKTNNNCEITINELITEGYIEDNLKDPSTGDKIIENAEKYKVKISWINSVKTCKIND